MKDIQIEVGGKIHEASLFGHATICGIGSLSKDRRTDKAVTCPSCLKNSKKQGKEKK